jgi:hypothetical protein
MAQKNSSGCFIAIIVAVLLAAVGGVALFSLIFLKAKEEKRGLMERHTMNESQMLDRIEASMPAQAGTDKSVILHANQLPHYSPHQAGKDISREQFVAFCTDNNTTSLARNAFQKTAQLSPVKWELRTSDISERSGKLIGRFSIPYRIHTGHSTQGGAVRVECEFDEESRNSLLEISRGDWITVRGKLTFNRNEKSGVLKEARIDDGSYTESPESQ